MHLNDDDINNASTVLFPTSRQESEIPSESYYNEIEWLGMMVIKDVDVPLLSDKDGDGEDLLNKRVQIKISPKKIDRCTRQSEDKAQRLGNWSWWYDSMESQIWLSREKREKSAGWWVSTKCYYWHEWSRKIMGFMVATACCVETGRNLWIPKDCRYQEYNFLKNPVIFQVFIHRLQ